MSSRSSKSDSRTDLPRRIVVGRVRKPHGVRGEVAIRVLSDVSGRFTAGAAVELVLAHGQRREGEIAAVRRRGDDAIVLFAGVETRDQAEELRAALVEVERSAVPEAPNGAYYYFELIGCVCTDPGVGELGRVTRVFEDGGGLILEIEKAGQSLLVPFVEAYLADVDTVGRRIEMRLPEGLIETCTSGS